PRADQWYVQRQGQKPIELPWDSKIDEFPRCYGFLPANDKHPTRLIVGHMYGASIFELRPSGPFRTRLLTGHDSEVNSMAISEDGQRLVTASRDETIAGWSLEDWPGGAPTGAQFYLNNDRLFVGAVDQGSPAWEAGLSPDDEIVFLFADGGIR